jgi:HPt (histidine-containing phosphotransfer) domain-containing protein
MKSIENRPHDASAPVASDDEFEKLRDAFYERLRNDRVRLTTLAASLARAESEPGCIFETLQFMAHRIRGAAAIFEAAEIGIASKALEQAAVTASLRRAANGDAAVWSALEALVDLLAVAASTRSAAVRGFGPNLHVRNAKGQGNDGPRAVRSRQSGRR